MSTLTRRSNLAAAFAACCGLAFSPRLRGEASFYTSVRIRLGLSEALFLDLNENDARAAVKAWTESVAGQSHIEVAGSAQLLRSDDMVRAIADHAVDGFSITTAEYAKVARFVDPVIFTDERSARTGVEYVLLVRQDSGRRTVASLRGRLLLAYQHVSMCLGGIWLETLLANEKLEPPDRFFSGVTRTVKVSQAVLPVFFGRADACLVTRGAFETMCELNPQLRRDLQVVATSPAVVTALLGVHKDSSAAIKNGMRSALLGLDDSPSGHQILLLFQSPRLVSLDSSALRPSLELVDAYERLRARRQGGAR